MGKQNAIQSFFTNDRMMLVLVLVNTIAIFVGGFFEASTFFIWSDSFFTILFVIEAIVKISTYGWKDYWKDGWNRFDFILTVVAIPSLMNSFLDFDLATNILLSLRALRIFSPSACSSSSPMWTASSRASRWLPGLPSLSLSPLWSLCL